MTGQDEVGRTLRSILGAGQAHRRTHERDSEGQIGSQSHWYWPDRGELSRTYLVRAFR